MGEGIVVTHRNKKDDPYPATVFRKLNFDPLAVGNANISQKLQKQIKYFVVGNSFNSKCYLKSKCAKVSFSLFILRRV